MISNAYCAAHLKALERLKNIQSLVARLNLVVVQESARAFTEAQAKLGKKYYHSSSLAGVRKAYTIDASTGEKSFPEWPYHEL